MASYQKTADVDLDIENIVIYTNTQWGAEQTRKYIAGLEQELNNLADGQTFYRNCDDLGKGIIMAKYEHHYIFALKRENQPLLILAIFHEKMDLMQRLKSRL